jgi:hypothetical protein
MKTELQTSVHFIFMMREKVRGQTSKSRYHLEGKPCKQNICTDQNNGDSNIKFSTHTSSFCRMEDTFHFSGSEVVV